MKILLTIIVAALLGGYWLYNKEAPTPIVTQNLPATCVDQDSGTDEAVPVITSLSKYSGSVGDTIEVRGCNFAGFEGDKDVWIENAQGVKGIIKGGQSATAKLIRATLTSQICQQDTSYSGLECPAYLNLTPGIYKIYTYPWGKKSNEVEFTVK